MKNENAIMDRVLRGNIKANFQTYQFTENDIGRSVFLTLEEAEKAVA